MEVDWEQEIEKIVGKEEAPEYRKRMTPMIPLWNQLLEKTAEMDDWPDTGDLLKTLMAASCRILPRFEDVIVAAQLSKQLIEFSEQVLDKKGGISADERFQLKLRCTVDAMSFMYAAGYLHAIVDKELRELQAEFKKDDEGSGVALTGKQLRKVIGEQNYKLLFQDGAGEDEVGD